MDGAGNPAVPSALSRTAPAGIAAQAAGFDKRAVLRLDGALNQQLADAARNEVAADTVAMLHAVSRRF